MTILAVFEIRKSRNKPFGCIEVHADSEHYYGIYFKINGLHRGFKPIAAKFGATLAIAYAARVAPMFARQQGCKWVYRADSKRQYRRVS